jgi:hypothetical protein
MCQVRTGRALEPLHDQMRIGTEAKRGVIQPVWVRLGIFYQVGHGRDPQRWAHREHLLLERHHRDRIELGVRVIAQLGIEQRIESDRVLRQQADGGAVGERTPASIGGDAHVAAGTIFHDDRLLGSLLEGVADGAREDVEGRPGGERHDDAKGLRWGFFGGNRRAAGRDKRKRKAHACDHMFHSRCSGGLGWDESRHLCPAPRPELGMLFL